MRFFFVFRCGDAVAREIAAALTAGAEQRPESGLPDGICRRLPEWMEAEIHRKKARTAG